MWVDIAYLNAFEAKIGALKPPLHNVGFCKKKSWTNVHKYWTGGKGKPECFIKEKKYPVELITLPFQCNKL